MSEEPKSAALDPKPSSAAASNPVIEITPNLAQYRQLCRDLALLREAGASSNTEALLAAVRAAAAE